ncbi:MAG: transposase [Draconibacterium sp.]
MPSIKNIIPLQAGSYYHLFNRGINHQNIFFQERNYHYFLQLLNKNLLEFIDVLAYCLLPNHFHLIIRVKEEIKVPDDNRDPIPSRDRIPKQQTPTRDRILTPEEISKLN